MKAPEVLKEILALSEEDRRWLVQETAATLPEQALEFALTEEETAELERRLANLHAHPENGIPWEEVKRQLLVQLEK